MRARSAWCGAAVTALALLVALGAAAPPVPVAAAARKAPSTTKSKRCKSQHARKGKKRRRGRRRCTEKKRRTPGSVVPTTPIGETPSGGPAPIEPASPSPAPVEQAPPGQGAPAPVTSVTAPLVTVVVGSVADVALPEAITSLASLEGDPENTVPGLSAEVHQGALLVVAANASPPGPATLVLHAVGCTAEECGRPVEVTVPVTIRALEAAEGQLSSLTEPAPERVAEAESSYLSDELIITVGTPEAPGTRAQAEASAQAVGGVVSGGIEAAGIYQIRWRSSQDLSTRKTELEAISVVTSVSYSSVGAYETTDAYPVAQPFQHQEFTWPYSQVHAQEAWAQTTGTNVTVGVIDEADVYRGDEDLNVVKTIGPYTSPLSSNADDPAHATHVAGLACARNNVASGAGTQLGMVGMAWGCPIVSASTVSNSSDGMLDLMEEMARDPSVRVVNISLGLKPNIHKEPDGNYDKCIDQSELEELERAIAKEASQFRTFLAGAGRNIVWVTSAGNSCAPTVGNAWGKAGAALPNVIGVAATNSDETLAVFSNYGAGVKVAAPGGFAMSPAGDSADTAGLMSSVPGVLDCPYAGYCPSVLCTRSECSEYEEMAGTSMSSPVVAGIAALAAAGNPGMSAAEIGTCVTGSAGAAGAPGVSDYTAHQSHVYPSHWLPAGYEFVPALPEGETIPIVDAAAAVECRHRHVAAAFRGSGGGDGWAVALSSSAVYNVFHHDSELQVACHFQADAEPCWSPETITDEDGDNFASSGQPGLWLDQSTGKLYVYATRWSDQRAGVVCIDTTEASTNPDPFCGFTSLTGEEESPLEDSISAVSDPTLIGSRWYAFNYVNGSPITGSKNKLLCFDVVTHAPCPGQPFAVSSESDAAESVPYPPPALAGIGSRVIVPMRFSGGEDQLACFDGSTESACPGSWPVDVGSYDSEYGAAFPSLDSSGGLNGLCLPTGTDPCYSLTGTPIATPPGMPEAVNANSGWNGPGVILGTRVYVPNGNTDEVDCYDYGTGASCANYPLFLTELGLLYTVNRDPERPGCLWVNSDDGTAQIQNFEASTGVGICG
jgi:Subtilase family